MCSPGQAPPGPAPAGDLPPEWETDDERMAFLFSAFKQSREVNSTEWDSKMAFWVGLVLARGRRRGVVRTCLRELQHSFERRGSLPLGLGTVVRELLRYRRACGRGPGPGSPPAAWAAGGAPSRGAEPAGRGGGWRRRGCKGALGRGCGRGELRVVLAWKMPAGCMAGSCRVLGTRSGV